MIASGDMFRTMAREDTPLAREIQDYMSRGDYVPDELTIKMILDRLREPDAQRGFILDGFPRTDAQARALDHFLAERDQKVDAALHITAPTTVLETRIASRMTCPVDGSIYNLETNPPKHDMVCDLDGAPLERRSDEEVETLRIRLKTHVRETQPLIEYYRKDGSLVEIDGSQPMNAVESVIDSALGLKSAS